LKLSDQDKFFFLKCAEELAELSVELLQAVNKPRKNNHKKILLEIQDAEKYFKEIKAILKV
jgi:hypothetical protein